MRSIIAFKLLIVPYGIETGNRGGLFGGNYLLIVPYGIETDAKNEKQIQKLQLLIVPYGIETRKKHRLVCRIYTFNCTLWN